MTRRRDAALAFAAIRIEVGLLNGKHLAQIAHQADSGYRTPAGACAHACARSLAAAGASPRCGQAKRCPPAASVDLAALIYPVVTLLRMVRWAGPRAPHPSRCPRVAGRRRGATRLGGAGAQPCGDSSYAARVGDVTRDRREGGEGV